MPHKNIVFVKLLWKELLHDDDRFMEQLNDEQKGLYLMLLLLAGATSNNIKNDTGYLKRVLNLHEKDEKLSLNLTKILEVFRNTQVINGYIKFKNFNKLHNYIWKRGGNTEGIPKEGEEKNRIDKNRIDEVVEALTTLKPILKSNVSYTYSRYGKIIKKLVILANDDTKKVVAAMKRMDALYTSKGLSWEPETLYKHWLEFSEEQKPSGPWSQKL